MYPRKFEDLILAFRMLPGVGQRTAQRYAFEALSWDEEQLKRFTRAIQDITNIHRCKTCGNLSEAEICSICADSQRDHTTICIIQNPSDIQSIESMEIFDGVYHVLNGLINARKGILPENLNIHTLLQRITPQTKEVILALDPTVEGETTALYLTKLLEGKTKVTRLASGLPMGGHLQYTDSRTLINAFTNRKTTKPE